MPLCDKCKKREGTAVYHSNSYDEGNAVRLTNDEKARILKERGKI